MRITNVTIEGMHNVTRKSYDFSDLTYLYGPNGAGKSTVLQAIQLALLGYIPGSSKASKAAIFEHTNGHMLAVTLTLDDDGNTIKVSRVWSGTKSNIVASLEIEPKGYDIHHIVEELELPIFNFNEFINMTANKLKDWFINFLPSAEVKIDWENLLSDATIESGVTVRDISDEDYIQHLVQDTVNYVNSLTQVSGSDKVRMINEYLKQQLAFKKKEVDRIQSTIQSLIYHDDVDMTQSIDDVEAKLQLLQSNKILVAQYAEQRKRNERINAELIAYADCNADAPESDPAYVKAVDDYASACNSITNYNKDIQEMQNGLNNIRSELSEIVKHEGELNATIKSKQATIATKGICPFTNTECDSAQHLIAQYTADVAKLTDELDNTRTRYFDCKTQIEETEAELHNIQQKIAEYERMKLTCESTKRNIVARYNTKHRLQSEIVIVPEVDDAEDDALIAELEDIKVRYKANERYNELVDKLTADKFQTDQELSVYKSWVNLTGVNGIQSSDDALKPFLDIQAEIDTYVQAVFGDDVKSKFNLETKANSFSFGLVRDGAYVPYNLLSSGEKCMYTLSLMLSLVKVSKSPLKLILIDDLLDHLDDVNVNKLFYSLRSVDDVQMIFAGVKSLEANTDIIVNIAR